jgi:5'-nucleotidase
VNILISNDDGYRSDGIRRLAAALAALPDVTVTVMAPERNRSGASNSLTLDVPLRVTQVEPGVNDGANLGDDVLYSGTVAAAIEGRFLGLPAMALSLCTQAGSRAHFDTGAEVAARLVRQLIKSPLDRALILNVNVPDLAYPDLKGFRTTRLGFRHRSEPVLEAHDPRGRPVYWVGPAGRGQDAGPGTDFDAVAEGFVSVTPLQIDLTRHAALPLLSSWLVGIDD